MLRSRARLKNLQPLDIKMNEKFLSLGEYLISLINVLTQFGLSVAWKTFSRLVYIKDVAENPA